jgi:hypothetical protein
MSQQGPKASGTVIRGADGAIYFIRDEVMEACRVNEKEVADGLGELLDSDQEVRGYAKQPTPIIRSAQIRPSLASSRASIPRETIMCPW